LAPSVKVGDRVKTDHRDLVTWGKLDRAGELTTIWIPEAAHEAMRDPVRAGYGGQLSSKARQICKASCWLLRHDQTYRGVRAWTSAYRR
jgi:hypothetical protein